jgi:hypothetical protein
MKGLRTRHRDRLLELDEVERRLKPFGRRYLGVSAIPVDALVGTEISADWYDAIYAPTFAAIDSLHLDRLYEDAPPGDLFLVLHRHRRDAFPSTGCPHFAQTVVSVIGNDGRRRRLRLPGRSDRAVT